MKKLSVFLAFTLLAVGCEMKPSSELTADSDVGLAINFERTVTYSDNNEEQARLRMVLQLQDNSDSSSIRVDEGELLLSTDDGVDDLVDNFIARYPFAFLGTSQASYIKDFDETFNLEETLLVNFSVNGMEYSANIELPDRLELEHEVNELLDETLINKEQLKAELQKYEKIAYVEITDCADLQNHTYMSCTPTDEGFTLKPAVAHNIGAPDITIDVNTQSPESELSIANFIVAISEDLKPDYVFEGFDTVDIKLIEKMIRDIGEN